MSDQTDGLNGVLDALEQAVTGARPMPMSSSVLVSRAELLDLIAQARDALPTQIADAARVLTEADAARAAAREEAERIEAAARRRAEELVSEQAVIEQAEQRAAEIVRAAQERAVELRREADDYCDRRLADFEIDLGKVLAQVQAGRAKLAQRLDDGV
ncbi:hypothetical protein [Cellulomonas sp. NPDC089187]|uniref:hypothetical protein n=1 Tax=Cellulomonas sp. NPDC089187 TaxID=3154970 RepID=UPI00342C17F9